MTKMRKKHETKNRGGNGINLIRKFDNDLNNNKKLILTVIRCRQVDI